MGVRQLDFEKHSAKIVKFHEILNSVKCLEILPEVKEEIAITNENYLNYINKIKMLEETDYKYFIETMKLEEKIRTQALEEDIKKLNVVEGFMNPKIRKDSIEYINEKINSYGNLIIPNIKRVHSIVMDGVSLEKEKNKSFRVKDVFVGYYDNNLPVVQYIPPKPSEIEEYMKEILDWLNNSKCECEEEFCFLNPIITHALIAILQPFHDGNTRVGRLVQYASMMHHHNIIHNYKFNSPIIYLSREYQPFRASYRENIANIAMDPSNDTWNQWILFNLYRIQDRILYANNFIDENFSIINNYSKEEELNYNIL